MSYQHDQLVLALHSQARRLRSLAETDALTGLDNRYHFERHLDEMLDKGQHFALAVIDVDHFKSLYDQAGHLAGDECLATLAKLLQQDGEHLARYGGESFVAWQAIDDPHQALAWGQSLVERVEKAQILHPVAPDGPWLTVSVGVTLSGCDNRRTMLARAEGALGEAKGLGRNRALLKPIEEKINEVAH